MTDVQSDEEKKHRKQQLKDAELRQELAAANEAELSLQRSELELESARDNISVVHAQPDYTGKFLLAGAIEDDHERGITPMINLRWRLRSFAERFPGAPIELTINSLGGEAHSGMMVYNTLRELSARGHFVTTTVGGWAASMAAVISQAGDHRVMGAESLLMLHEPNLGMIGNASEFREQGEFLESLAMQFARIFGGRSTMTPEDIRNGFRKKEWWVFPGEALSLGFVDEVAGVTV